MQPVQTPIIHQLRRIRLWYGALLVLSAIFIIRLFYLQVIRHDYYQKAALSDQLKEYQIPAERGVITAHSGNQQAPLVLNETLYTLFADPKYVQDTWQAAHKVQDVIGGNAADYEKAMKTDSRYVILAKKLTKDQKAKIDDLKLKGVGTREAVYRTYPQGQLASQLLGFVNDDGQGKYGIEQAMNNELKGTPGQLKAITDAQGVPLASNRDNVDIAPNPGKQLQLTVDLGMQQQLEDILKQGLDAAKSTSGGALIMDPNTGAIKAMANYPTYSPAQFFNVTDPAVFTNAVVSSPMEVGSTMKPLTAAAALDQGVVTKDTTYFDPSRWKIGDATVTNIEEDGGPGVRSISDILQLSLNTGATWLLMQMGGGQINQKARVAWHSYLVDHYQFGKSTGVEQGYEADGYVPSPTDGFGLDIQYANMAFGQGMAITPLQLGAALSSVVNGGTYYKPYLIEKTVDENNNKVTVKQPQIAKTGVVKPEVSQTIKSLMEYVISKNYLTYGMSRPRPEYSIGGKTGTAQDPKPGGGYYEDRFNGTFMGFVGGDKAQYVIVVRVNEPKIGGYAGSKAAAPIFGKLANMLIDNFSVTPKGQ
ncbi:MAG TPA: penicillin-binding protein 2 [Candidatus Saccharimonadales bacterium]|nr:penicillin-binding protein 2 [Candidatus Saccharimonadales bacterium]